MSTSQLLIDRQIKTIDEVICRHIDKIGTSDRGVISQDILAQLRNFLEHIMLKIYANGQDIENTYDNIQKAMNYVKTLGQLKFLRRFHEYLQIVVSHYTLDEENSERLMLKYYEYLFIIKNFLSANYSLNTLENLDKFPLNSESNMKEYYEKISYKINLQLVAITESGFSDRFYIKKIKPFFVGQKIYYEVTITPATERLNKLDRFIVFTALDISPFYAVKLCIVHDTIELLEKKMPISIITKWESSIRPCEFDNFGKLLGLQLKTARNKTEYSELMRFLTESGFNLIEIIDFPEDSYCDLKEKIHQKANTSHLFDVLDKCRAINHNNNSGLNVIRYLLYHLNNKIIKHQCERNSNTNLSGLCLKNGCIPFDKMPFSTSLVNHNPKLATLFECIDSAMRIHELLARLVKNNTDRQGQLYTHVNDLSGFGDIDTLIKSYNQNLYLTHTGRMLIKRHEHLFIKEYEDDTLFILKRLISISTVGIQNFSNYFDSWIVSSGYIIDCDEKKVALRKIFESSSVALIYGSAGTGKSTLINHISHLFSQNSKLYLANTNPAVDNLKRRVNASNCEFMTINRFLFKRSIKTDYDLLIIDECSTVNNGDLRKILNKAQFKLLVLVGDIYQIEAIQFGNWFSAARGFLPTSSIFELTKPYRSNNKNLLELWHRVRSMDETILELIARQGYSVTLDASIFNREEQIDQIILCLNYDGLYGINNINRFLQQNNPNPAIRRGIHDYKIGDPILFNESERFAPLICNNAKGWISAINVFEDRMQFEIELDKVVNGLEASGYDFELLQNSARGNSVIRFFVNKYKSTDEDEDMSLLSVIPFQVTYALSIHKAQGLEYDSVKIVIADEVDELITHNIFYTAITRAKDKLKIYWTPEIEKKVLSRIKPKNNGKDLALLKLCDPTLCHP